MLSNPEKYSFIPVRVSDVDITKNGLTSAGKPSTLTVYNRLSQRHHRRSVRNQ